MFWMGIAVTLVAGIIVIAVILARRPVYDLGTVSDHWIAEHRVEVCDAPSWRRPARAQSGY